MRFCVCRTNWGAAVQKKIGARADFFCYFLIKTQIFGTWLGGLGHCAMSVCIQGGPLIFFRTGWVRSGAWPVLGCMRGLSVKLCRMGCARVGGACMGLGAAVRRGAPLVQGMAPWFEGQPGVPSVLAACQGAQPSWCWPRCGDENTKRTQKEWQLVYSEQRGSNLDLEPLDPKSS